MTALLTPKIERTRVFWSEDLDEDVQGLDASALYDGAEKVFDAAGLRIARNVTPGHLIVENGEVVAATCWRVYDDAERLGELAKLTICEPPLIYDFDLAVRPDKQGGTLGFLLIQSNIREARELECAGICLWVINPVVTRLLEKHFGFSIDNESMPDGRYSAHVTKWLP